MDPCGIPVLTFYHFVNSPLTHPLSSLCQKWYDPLYYIFVNAVSIHFANKWFVLNFIKAFPKPV
jgi:hypothetical protein